MARDTAPAKEGNLNFSGFTAVIVIGQVITYVIDVKENIIIPFKVFISVD